MMLRATLWILKLFFREVVEDANLTTTSSSLAEVSQCCETTNRSLVNFLKRPDVQLDVEKLNNYLIDDHDLSWYTSKKLGHWWSGGQSVYGKAQALHT